MAGGSFTPAGVAKERVEQYQGRVTPYVIIACIVAAVGGSIFGYDIGISGGVTSMDEFLEKFFYTVYKNKRFAHENNYCKYNNQGLAAFTSTLYLAGLVATLVASPVTRKYGRRVSIICGGVSFLVGAVLNASAANLAMLLLGRIMLGIGIGFGNQAVPLYLSEMAPTHLRGGLNMMFQLATTLGIFTANMINYGTSKLHPWGWRLSLGLAAAPALLMTVGGVLLPETPNSLIEQGLKEKGREVLQKIRGTKNVNAEFEDMIDASELANSIKHPFRNILKRRHRPQLIMAILMPTFQILTGINSILFYAPVLFQSMGFKGNASLYSSALTGAVLALSTLLSIATVDRWGRRPLLIGGGIQMIVCEIVIAIILGLKFGNNKELSKGFSILVVVIICLFVAAFGWSWGPLGWTVPSEIFPLETRSAGQSITVAVNLLFTFIIAQSFLSLLCALKSGFFLFFAGLITIMTIFVYVFLPETKGVPIEEMILLWQKHWFWKKIVTDEIKDEDSNSFELRLKSLSLLPLVLQSLLEGKREAPAMAGGAFTAAGVAEERAGQYQGRVTCYVIVACIVAAIGGSIFGYDIGISGGVTSMDGFLQKFFPVVYRNKMHAHENNYCKYNNQGLAAFTSSLYLAGLVASIVASPITRKYGRRASIVCGGISFIAGATLDASAQNLAMLILGRVMLGFGIGFGNQAVPLYLSEMAPAHLRGGLNMMFQLATTLGIFTANMINYGTEKLQPWGWRLGLGLAGVPAIMMTVGGILLPETPNSLIERGSKDEGREILEKIRGTANVHAELQDIVDASELANAIEHPFRNILERRNRPQLVIAIFMPTFQILTGINSILFYAPVLFQSMGFGRHASLYSSAMTGAVLVSSTIVSIATVDRWGRRVLLIGGGIQMIICQVVVAIILGLKLGSNGELSNSFSILVVVVICFFVAAFGWSWGSLGWTVPSEVFALETRSAGQSITVAVNFLFTFVIGQSFLSLLCAFKFGIFLFFAGWITVMTIFVYAFLPETKGVPIEEMIFLWRRHWYWKRFASMGML
ncbi:hypothetical protein RJ639_036983 [Escallonia herrerae]|uniref:Major facilitator superfamily (MFS) profile domain-containing protein n=1 Tax=Escallonia herrerae TaxID=1293975 RepID=A0AA88WSE8_9ASTE|nr:hypothetical protein RJ639_036983 [Escallonia herrerae]